MYAPCAHDVICLVCGDLLSSDYFNKPSEFRHDFIMDICASMIKYLEDKGIVFGGWISCFPDGDKQRLHPELYDYDKIFEPFLTDGDLNKYRIMNIFFDGAMVYLLY